VTVNGCEYTFNATKNTNSAAAPTPGILTPFSADLTVVCPAGKQIEIHVYNTAAHNDVGVGVLCTYNIGPQQINNQIRLTNIVGAPNDILAHIHANVAVTTASGGICGAANQTAVYKGTDTLQALNAVGVPVAGSVS
jgi:hypothetical protein